MSKRNVYGKWQKQVQKVLLKRCLQNRNKQSGDTAAKTAEQQLSAENSKQG
jgi:hypothetical protein